MPYTAVPGRQAASSPSTQHSKQRLAASGGLAPAANCSGMCCICAVPCSAFGVLSVFPEPLIPWSVCTGTSYCTSRVRAFSAAEAMIKRQNQINGDFSERAIKQQNEANEDFSARAVHHWKWKHEAGGRQVGLLAAGCWVRGSCLGTRTRAVRYIELCELITKRAVHELSPEEKVVDPSVMSFVHECLSQPCANRAH